MTAKRLQKIFAIIVFGFSTLTHAVTLDLLAAYDLAQHNDLSFQNAKATHQAALQLPYIKLAPLLPQISGNASAGDNATLTPVESSATSFGSSFDISLQQVIFDYGLFKSYNQAYYLTKAADQVYIGAQQDLILNLTNAYFSVIHNYDDLVFQQKTVASFAGFLKQTTAKFNVGQNTLSDIDIAQSNYDNSTANKLISQNDVATAKETLLTIINYHFDDLYRLKPNLKLQQTDYSDINQLIKEAERGNPEINANYYQMLAAKENINIMSAQHYPTFNFNALANASQSQGQVPPWIYSWSVGINFSLNIYSGGGINAQIHQAQFQYLVAKENYKLIKRTVIQNLIAADRSIKADVSQITALQSAVEAAQQSTESSRKAYSVGLETTLDITRKIALQLDAENQYSNARHVYFLDKLRLKRLLGDLQKQDLVNINKLMFIQDNKKR